MTIICWGNETVKKLLVTFALLAFFAGSRFTFAVECAPLVTTDDPGIGSVKHRSGLLWRLTHADKAASYLLGTMHVSDPRVTGLIEIVQDELEQSDRFVMEAVLDLNATVLLQSAMFYTDGRRLSDVTGSELFELASDRLQNYGIPALIAESMKPWAVFTTLSLPAGQAGVPLDLELMSTAQAAGKEVLGLETVQEQIEIFESIPEPDQVEILRELACHYDHFQSDIEQMVRYYHARDLFELVRLSLRYQTEEKQAFLDALLWQRNERMVQRLAPILDQGKAFIAVGAMHLPGERGILQRLEQQGFVVQAIY